MTPLEMFLELILTGLSIIILIISILALRKKRSFKFAMIVVAFVLCSAQGILSLAAEPMGWDGWNMSVEMLLLNIGIVVAIYIAIVKG